MIFISHAHQDHDLAARLCEALEKGGRSCWIAPRDVTPGQPYAAEIMRALEASDAVVLLLSAHANTSDMVAREIERAISKNKTVIPLKLRGTTATGALEFLVSSQHWIDVKDAPVEQYVDQLVDALPKVGGVDVQHDPLDREPERSISRRTRLWLVPVLLAGIASLGVPIVRQQREHARLAKLAAEMVKIPAGDFWMGCNEKVDLDCEPDEKPGRSQSVEAFAIDRTEVTAARYRECVTAGKCTDTVRAELCNGGLPRHDNHPINCVDWYQAKAYCEWAGKRLPTETEWEKAARGTDGLKFPWGNEAYDEDHPQAYLDGFPDWGTKEVGSFSPSKTYGLSDMSGNVSEWASDQVGSKRAVRGGSWNYGSAGARASYRESYEPDRPDGLVGFRCAQ